MGTILRRPYLVLACAALAVAIGVAAGLTLHPPAELRLVGRDANLPRPDDSLAHIKQISPYRVREVRALPPESGLTMASYVRQSMRVTHDAFSVDLAYLAGGKRLQVWMTNISDAELAQDGKSPLVGPQVMVGGASWYSGVTTELPASEQYQILSRRLDDGVLVSISAPLSFERAAFEAAARSLE